MIRLNNSKWTVFAFWCLSGAVIAAVKAGLIPEGSEAIFDGIAGTLFGLPLAIGGKK